MGFFDVMGDLFTGRWLGGQSNLAQDFSQDPLGTALSLAVPVAAPFALPAILPALGAGAAAVGTGLAEGAGAVGSGVSSLFEGAGSGVGSLFGSGGAAAAETAAPVSFLETAPASLEAGAMTGSDVIPTSASLTSAQAGAVPGVTQVAGGYGIPGAGSAGDLVSGVIPAAEPGATVGPYAAPVSTAGGGGGGGIAGAFDTLTSPSQWTLPGVMQAGGVAATGGLLLSNLMKGNPPTPSQTQATNTAGFLETQAPLLTAESAQLRSYLESGTLPPAQQAQIDQLVKNQKAQIIQAYASKGRSTVPGTNSTLDQELAAVDRQGLIAAGQMEQTLFTAGNDLLKTGLSSAGMAGNLFTGMADLEQKQNSALAQAVANFAAALAPSKGVSLNFGKAA